jgi:hypothetical protein
VNDKERFKRGGKTHRRTSFYQKMDERRRSEVEDVRIATNKAEEKVRAVRRW